MMFLTFVTGHTRLLQVVEIIFRSAEVSGILLQDIWHRNGLWRPPCSESPLGSAMRTKHVLHSTTGVVSRNERRQAQEGSASCSDAKMMSTSFMPSLGIHGRPWSSPLRCRMYSFRVSLMQGLSS